MRKITVLLIFMLLINLGCAGKKKPLITNGLPQEQVQELWGEPSYTIPLGMTKKEYPVEVWEYQQKGSFFRRSITHTLVFVDKELYGWAVNDSEAIMEMLDKLGIVPENKIDFNTQNYQQWLNSVAVKAQRTKQTMDTIQTYKNHQMIQMQIQHQQQIRILQQQQMPPPPKPPRPIKQQP